MNSLKEKNNYLYFTIAKVNPENRLIIVLFILDSLETIFYSSGHKVFI
jgi:hypothetical protein